MQAVSRAENAARSVLQNLRSLHHLNAFISRATPESIEAQLSEAKSQSPLRNKLIAVKDNICTEDLPTTCASTILEGYRSPFDATVVSKLRSAGGIMVGKTNLDEFGMGSHNLFSSYGAVVNAKDAISPGGSSGGSAVAVASGQCDGALGTDTGGSVRLPAAYNSILGFKPSYGLVSRWGVIAYANSLDTVGFLAKTPEMLKNMFGAAPSFLEEAYKVVWANVVIWLDACNEFDSRDPTSLSRNSRQRVSDTLHGRPKSSKLRVGVPIECNLEELSPVVRSAWSRTLQMLRDEGHAIHTVSLPTLKSALSAYYIIAPAEASSNLAKYDNTRYGNPDLDKTGLLFTKARGDGFGSEVKRRILLGAYSLSAEAIDNYFIQAQKIRRMVQADFSKVFALPNVIADYQLETDREGSIDCLICPTSPTLPPDVDAIKKMSPLEAYAGDVLAAPANLAGVPAISVPVKMTPEEQEQDSRVSTVGIQVITQYGDDHKALEITAELLNIQK